MAPEFSRSSWMTLVTLPENFPFIILLLNDNLTYEAPESGRLEPMAKALERRITAAPVNENWLV